VLKLYKVSRRRDLDISAFTAAIRLRTIDSRVDSATIAYGGVAPTVVRMPKTEAFLQGKPLTVETFAEAGRVARGEVNPITDVRGSRDYRLQLAENILCKFYYEAVAR
jgi:xanthine dehydrogenase small subunit